jgi:hypothetical protein
MTVFNTNYSSIDEAFGYLNPELQQQSAKKSKKKIQKDPLCELYNQKNQTPYTDTDLVMYANQYRYNKNEYQDQNINGRESPTKYIDVSDQETKQEIEKNYDFQPSRIIQEENIPGIRSESYNRVYNESQNRINDEEAMLRALTKKYTGSSESCKKINYIDLILYIISGIILIFILEQFIKVGQYMAAHTY